jgi:hypothetical protein
LWAAGKAAGLEGIMVARLQRPERRNRVLVGGVWAAGIGITLVEMNMGMDYVLSHVVNHVSAIVGWLPMIGTLVKVWR